MAAEKKTIKIGEDIHEELKGMLGFTTFDQLFERLIKFKKLYKMEWAEFIKKHHRTSIPKIKIQKGSIGVSIVEIEQLLRQLKKEEQKAQTKWGGKWEIPITNQEGYNDCWELDSEMMPQ